MHQKADGDLTMFATTSTSQWGKTSKQNNGLLPPTVSLEKRGSVVFAVACADDEIRNPMGALPSNKQSIIIVP